MYGSNPSPFAPRALPSSLYARVGLETEIHTASAHRLVTLLFDGVYESMAQARGAIQTRNTMLKNRSITRAVRILDEGLKAALNLEAGQLATDLRDLYAWLCMRLTYANLHSDAAAIEQCERILAPVREAWTAIAAQADVPRAA
ncbi:MAG: flagellar export chaperone FliS [Paucibacter sp.]|nr:flagellar export chaperone FliS [Roseateles sp.]